MANSDYLARLRQGTAVWNAWRTQIHVRRVDLSEADLCGARLDGADLGKANLIGADLCGARLDGADLESADLRGANLHRARLVRTNLRGALLEEADLRRADLREAHLDRADLYGANLREADLEEANLRRADLYRADLSGARLDGADLRGANLWQATLRRADLQGTNLRGADLDKADLDNADLRFAILVQMNLSDANLTGCRIYGISAWDLNLKGAIQRNLAVTQWGQPEITIDNIEVGQFIYLLLYNEKIRDVIDTITSKVVLILGRFTQERKSILNALRDELRKRDYLPVLFDFDKPASRDITETVSLLARMARFVIADITEARSIPQELAVITPDLPSVPIQPLLQEGADEYGMFEHFRRYPWVLKEHLYASPQQLIADINERVIAPAEAKVRVFRVSTK